MLIGSRIAVALSLTLVVTAGVGCASEDRTAGPQSADQTMQPQAASQSESTQQAPMASSDQSTRAPTPAAQTAPQQAPQPTALTDEQIFAVLDAANDKEIEESRGIEAKSKNREVKAFAKMMIQHHTDAKTKGQKLATKLGVTPAEFEKSRELRDDTTKQADQLKAASVTDLDRQYIDLMVQDHKAVLDMIDNKLLSDVKNADLKALIQEVRPTVASHLTAAEALQAKMSSGGANPNVKTPKSTSPNTGKQPPPDNTMQPSPPGATGPAAKKNPGDGKTSANP